MLVPFLLLGIMRFLCVTHVMSTSYSLPLTVGMIGLMTSLLWHNYNRPVMSNLVRRDRMYPCPQTFQLHSARVLNEAGRSGDEANRLLQV